MEKEQMSVGSRGGRVKVDGVDVGGWAGGEIIWEQCSRDPIFFHVCGGGDIPAWGRGKGGPCGGQ